MCAQNSLPKRQGAKKLGSVRNTVQKTVIQAVPGRSLVTGVTGVFSFLRQTGFDKVAQGAFLAFQAAPSDFSSWMFGDSVMLGDVYYRCKPPSPRTCCLAVCTYCLATLSLDALCAFSINAL